MVTGIDDEDFEFDSDDEDQADHILSAVQTLQVFVYGKIDRARYYGDSITVEDLEHIRKELLSIGKTYG